MARTAPASRSNWTGRLLLVFGLVGLVLIGTAVAVGIYFYQQSHETRPPEELLKIGKEHLRLRQWGDAYSNLIAAARERPNDPEYQWPAAQAAARVGERVEAIEAARKTWENGRRDTEVLMLRVALLDEDETTTLATAQKWLSELPDSADKRETEATILFRHNEFEAALPILENLVEEEATPERVTLLARIYVQLGRPNQATTLLNSHREEDNLDHAGYSTLLALLAVQSHIYRIEEVAAEAAEKGFDTDSFRLQYGLVLLGWRMGEEAAAELTPVSNPYRLRPEDFQDLHGFLADLGSPETPMLLFLYDAIPDTMRGTLTGFERGAEESPALEVGYLNPLIQHLRQAVASEEFLSTEFLATLDLPQELRTRVSEDLSPPEEALVRRQILESTLSDYIQHSALDLTAHKARLGLSLYRAAQEDAEAIRALRGWAMGEGRALEGERLFYDYLVMAIREQDEGRRDLLAQARALLEGQGIPTIFAAREALRARETETAINLYRRVFVEEPLLARGPLVMMETAAALAAAERNDEALSLVYLLMQREAYSRRVFEMIRDLEEDPTRREAAMSALREMYPEDPTVRAQEALVRIQQDDLEGAESTLLELMQDYPEEKNFEVMRLMLLVEKGALEEALAEADKSDAPPEVLAAVRARALTRLERIDEAKEQYRIALDAREGDSAAPIALEYANLLLVTGEYDQAEPLYRQALQTMESHPVAHLGLATIAVQRNDLEAARPHVAAVTEQDLPIAYAYFLQAQLDMSARNPTAALANIEQALDITTDYPAARLLRSNILLQMGRMEDAELGLQQFLRDVPGHLGARGQLAVVKGRLRKYDEALAILGGLIEDQPDNPTLRLFRLELLLMAQRPAEAREALDAVRENIPEELARIHESTILQQEGRLEEAIALLEPHREDQRTLVQWAVLKILNKSPEGVWEALADKEMPWTVWTRVASMANLNQQFPLAARAYERALAQRENDPVLLNNFAWTALLSGEEIAQPDEIVDAARRAYEAQPGELRILDTYVTVLGTYQRQADLAALIDGKERIIQNHPRIMLYGARAFAAEGETDRAVRLYERLLELDMDPWPLRNAPKETIREELAALQAETAAQP